MSGTLDLDSIYIEDLVVEWKDGIDSLKREIALAARCSFASSTSHEEIDKKRKEKESKEERKERKEKAKEARREAKEDKKNRKKRSDGAEDYSYGCYCDATTGLHDYSAPEGHVLEFVDDIELMRYCMSFKRDKERAVDAVRRGVSWRRNHTDLVKSAQAMAGIVHDDLDNNSFKDVDDAVPLSERQECSKPPRHIYPYIKTIRKLLPATTHKSTRKGDPVVVGRLGLGNIKLLMDLVPPHVLRDYIVFSNEVEWWHCNSTSRYTGRVVKCFRIIDMKSCSSKMMDKRFLRVFSECSRISEAIHPQLVAKTIIINAPSYIRWVVDALKYLGFSKRALDKIWVHKTSTSPTSGETRELVALIAPENLPSFFNGGLCDCFHEHRHDPEWGGGGCMALWENDALEAAHGEPPAERKGLENELETDIRLKLHRQDGDQPDDMDNLEDAWGTPDASDSETSPNVPGFDADITLPPFLDDGALDDEVEEGFVHVAD